MKIKSYKIRAGSLIYVLLLSLLVAIFLTSMIMISSYYLLKESDVNFQKAIQKQCNESFYFENINKLKWGIFQVLVCEKNNQTFKARLYANIPKPHNDTILFLSKNTNILKVGGNSIIKGYVEVPKGELRTVNYHGIPFEGYIPTMNKVLQAQKAFPKIQKINFVKPINRNIITYQDLMDSINDNFFYNSFKKETIEIKCKYNDDFHNLHLKGNIIISVKDSICISGTARLNDLIIEGKKIIFNKGFSGNVQIFSKEKVILHEKVNMYYPSFIYLFNDSLKESYVKIKENSLFLGSIIIDGNKPQYNAYRLLYIERGAQIYGRVYCKGSIELKGSIYGNAYTNKFILTTPESYYDNFIFNGKLIYSQNNKYFNFALLDYEKYDTAIFIKEL